MKFAAFCVGGAQHTTQGHVKFKCHCGHLCRICCQTGGWPWAELPCSKAMINDCVDAHVTMMWMMGYEIAKRSS